MGRGLAVAVMVLALAGAAPADEEPSAAQRLLAEGDALFKSRRYYEATKCYERAVDAADPKTENETLVEALAMAARGYLIRDAAEPGRPLIEHAAKLAKTTEPKGWSRYLGVRGRFEWKDGDKPTAAKTFEAMYRYCLEHELYSRAVDAAHMVAIVGTHQQQVEWAKKGIAAAKKGGMDGWLGPLWNNLGNTYGEMGRHEDALQAFLEARHYHWKVGSEHHKLVADWAVGMAYRKLGRLDKAKQWLRPVLAWAERRLAEEEDDDARREWVALARAQLGLVALAEGRKAEAAKLLAPACDALEKAGMPEWDPAGWKEYTDARNQASAAPGGRQAPPRRTRDR